MGYDVEIVALQKGDLENTHASFNTYRLEETAILCGGHPMFFKRPAQRLLMGNIKSPR